MTWPGGGQHYTDPSTGKVETAPCKVADIVYTDSMAAPCIKTGTYLASDPQARRNYPWMDQQCEDHFLLETPITRAENDTQRRREWLHSSILDSCSLQECIQPLTNNKTPGPDGIANELLKHLPQEYKESIHKLFIIMCATGRTPKTWKKRDTVLTFKERAFKRKKKRWEKRTDLNSNYIIFK